MEYFPRYIIITESEAPKEQLKRIMVVKDIRRKDMEKDQEIMKKSAKSKFNNKENGNKVSQYSSS